MKPIIGTDCACSSTRSASSVVVSSAVGNAEASPNRLAACGGDRGRAEAGAKRLAVGSRIDSGMGANHAE